MSVAPRPAVPGHAADRAADNLRGSLWMVAAMGAFAVEDLLVKFATASLPVWQVLVLFGTGGGAIFAAFARRAGEPLLHPRLGSRALVVRSACEIVGRLFFTLSLAYTTLSATSAILQATPLVVVLGAVLFLGERVGWRRWCAMGVGFAGVLLILRPGLDGFEASSLLAVAGTLGFAGRDLATRASPATMSNRQLGLYGFAALTVAGLLCVPLDPRLVPPSPPVAAALAGAIVVGVLAYASLTAAMRLGEVSVVTPFRYARLVFAVLLGTLVFGERPDAATLAGGAIVVASGVYTVLRGRTARGR